MKGRFRAALLVCCLGLAAVGCGKKENADNKNSGKQETAELGSMDKYVKLGEYRGITVARESEPVTEEQMQGEISYYLARYPEAVTDPEAVIQKGDSVSVTYEGRIDGELFDNGSGTEEALVIGSQSFIDGFEDGLIGMKKGESKDLNLKFPDDYNKEVGGKDVVFHVTVNSFKRPLGTMTDEWVTNNTDYKNVEEFQNKIRENLTETYENGLETGAWTQVVDSCEILEYPESEVEAGRELFDKNMKLFAQQVGMTLEQLMQVQGLDDDGYAEQQDYYAHQSAAASLVLKAIIEKEGFTTEDSEYQELYKKYLSESGKTEEEFIEANGEDVIQRNIMLERVMKIIMDNAVFVEATPTPAGAAAE